MHPRAATEADAIRLHDQERAQDGNVRRRHSRLLLSCGRGIIRGRTAISDPMVVWHMESFAFMLQSKIFVRSAMPGYLAVKMDNLREYLCDVVGHIYVDEAWYLRTYADVAKAVTSGELPSGKEHYRLFGYYEHRRPYAITVDGAWYLAQYVDVGQAIADGTSRDSQAHFDQIGYAQARLPYPGFSLRQT